MQRHIITVTRTITRSSSPPATPPNTGISSVPDGPAYRAVLEVLVLHTSDGTVWALCAVSLPHYCHLFPSQTVTTLLTPSPPSPPSSLPHHCPHPPHSLTTVPTLLLFTVYPTETTRTAAVVTSQQVLEVVREKMLQCLVAGLQIQEFTNSVF